MDDDCVGEVFSFFLTGARWTLFEIRGNGEVGNYLFGAEDQRKKKHKT